MPLSMYAMARDTFVPMLKSLSDCLEKGEAQKGRALDLAGARLAPDMFTLSQQVQEACFHARNTMARLAGQPAVARAAAASTIGGAIDQIHETIEAVRAVTEADFTSPETVDCSLPIPGNKTIAMNGPQFLQSWSLPHFYFHVVTGFDILRHAGVEIGKIDYMSKAAGGFVRDT